MKFTLNWLKEFVPVKITPDRLAQLLTMAGLEVESIVRSQEAGSGKEDWLFEIAVTPNRGDCLGILGLAREISALTGERCMAGKPGALGKAVKALAGVTIVIEDARLCPRYSAAVVENIKIAAGPDLMKYRLESCGIRSINNVVDITNYVMFETGQPLHAFDLDRLVSGRIVVRPSGEPRRFQTLDGNDRELVAEDLLICDGERPVALAGIMGGADSEVTDETRRILLESAHFDPISIRRTAKRLGVRSEASYRFERGVDPEGTVAALDRAVALLAGSAGGKRLEGHLDRYPSPMKRSIIELREDRIERFLGVRIERQEAEKLLTSCGLQTEPAANKSSLRVLPPSYRPDLAREADLIEELARFYGYAKVPSTLPLLRSPGGKRDRILMGERRMRAFLAGEGFSEVINLPFTSEKLNRWFSGIWGGAARPVALINPLVSESAEMRLSLVPGLLDSLRTNLAQKAASFFAYQLGKVFRSVGGGEAEERQCLGGIMYGPRARRGLRIAQESAAGFLECKGVVEGVLDLARLNERVTWASETVDYLHPGKAAAIIWDGRKLGYLGAIHPDICDAMDLPSCMVFELDFEGWVQYAPRQITIRSLPRFPSIERDFAIVVDRGFPSRQVIHWINGLGHGLIERVEVFDQYEGAPVPAGKKSLAYKISYRAEDRTLTDTEVSALHQDLIGRIAKAFDAQLRV
jgi:phenylalanyl-tRNA synthetase beta chain